MTAAPPERGRAVLGDERGLVGKAAVVLLLIVVLAGLVLIEGGSIVFARLQIQDLAAATAVEGAATYRNSGSVDQARDAAKRYMSRRDADASLTRFVVAQDGAVMVTVKKKARTFIVQHIGFLEDLAVAKSTETASPPSV